MIETCRICLDSNDKIVCDVEDYLSIIQRIAQIDVSSVSNGSFNRLQHFLCSSSLYLIKDCLPKYVTIV